MKELTLDELRALIRLIPALRALREELEKSLHLEFYKGMGDMALKSYRGLQASVYQIAHDPYVEALIPEVAADASDKQKVAVVMLAASQLLAFVEGQTGVAGIGGGPRPFNVQTAPNISLNMGDVSGGGLDRLTDVLQGAMRGMPPGGMPPGMRPPRPPRPPRPSRPPRGPRGPQGAWAEWEESDEDDDDEA